MFEKPLIVGVLAATGLGEVSTMSFANPVNAVLQFGSFGVLCLLVLHVFRHTIPRLATGYDTNIQEARSAFIETLNSQRSDFRDEMRLERASSEHRIQELTLAIKDLNNLIRERKNFP